MPGLQLRPLQPDELEVAYPLVRRALRIGFASWLGLAEELRREGGGILAVFGGHGLPLGLAAYRFEACLRCGACLRVELLAAFEIGRVSAVRAALWRGVEQLAAARSCGATICRAPPGR